MRTFLTLPVLNNFNRLGARALAAILALFVVVSSSFVLYIGPARADDATDRATAKTIMAQSLYKSGQFAKAAATYLDAYAIAPRATLLFNAARAYEEAGLADEAIALFERYHTLKDADAEGKKDAAKRLESLRTKRAFPSTISERETARVVTPPPVPRGDDRNVPTAPDTAPLADDRLAGERDGRKDAEAEISSPMWFLAGCLVFGIPLAYASGASPPPSRMMGRTPEYAAAYGMGYRYAGSAKQRTAVVYGCLTGIALGVLGAVAR